MTATYLRTKQLHKVKPGDVIVAHNADPPGSELLTVIIQ